MTWILLAFLLGVLVSRWWVWWFVLRALGLTVWMAGHVFVLVVDNMHLQRAVDAEQARESEALRRAQLDLIGRMGTR